MKRKTTCGMEEHRQGLARNSSEYKFQITNLLSLKHGELLSRRGLIYVSLCDLAFKTKNKQAKRRVNKRKWLCPSTVLITLEKIAMS